ncbi:hypothetical protein DPMN_136828 [Dreissena polymorpha]|uniref:Uncharacterized protein n=1 Tax=Dreissena polymorpha TaxID=45954 RepID=A0A9D4G6M8_DREPO|nr:hypothetical protein DPMN_136828 [Dreissena polymorpha]
MKLSPVNIPDSPVWYCDGGVKGCLRTLFLGSWDVSLSSDRERRSPRPSVSIVSSSHWVSSCVEGVVTGCADFCATGDTSPFAPDCLAALTFP